MNVSYFSLQFDLNICEIQELNKMYFEHIYKKRILIISCIAILILIFFDWNNNDDFIEWIIRSVIVILFFLIVQYSFVNSISRIIFKLTEYLVKSKRIRKKYRFDFTPSVIYIHSPFGNFKHNWSKIDKAFLTKDFLFLYVREKNRYIISISNKNNGNRNIQELITFVENNVTHINKI